MKYVKLYDSQSEAVGQTVDTPILAGIRGVNKVMYGSNSNFGDSVTIVSDDSFIQGQEAVLTPPTYIYVVGVDYEELSSDGSDEYIYDGVETIDSTLYYSYIGNDHILDGVALNDEYVPESLIFIPVSSLNQLLHVDETHTLVVSIRKYSDLETYNPDDDIVVAISNTSLY